MAITPNNYSFSGGAFMGGDDTPVARDDIHSLNITKNGESIGNYNPLVGDAIIDIPSDAFVCYYDSTTAAQIHDARRSGKAPYLYKDGIIVPLWKTETGKFTFRTTSTREVYGDTYLDIVDYVVEDLAWSTEIHTVSGSGGSQQAYLKKVSSLAVFDTTGHSGMETVAYVNDVPVDGVYQVSVMLSVTPKTASPTKSNLVFGFYGNDGVGMPGLTFHAVVDDSQTFSQQLSFSTTLNLKKGSNSLKLLCDDLNTQYLVFVDDLTVAQLMNGGGTEYTEGEGIKIENDKISVDYGSGLEVDPLTNKLKVKIGNGLKFNEESPEVEIDSDVEDVVEAVEKLTDDLDKKITTTYPFAQITTQGDFAVFGVTNTSRMIGQLFAVPIASEIRKNETMICVNALQSFNGKVSFGIFEYDFEGNNGSGSTYWVADTGVVNVVAGENEFPLKYVDRDVHELKSSMLYYAVVAIAGDAPATGLFLAAAPNYAATYNANPKYTLLVSNMNQYIDWTTGTLQGAWFQGYNEDNTIPRLFMMLRNGEATPPIPVTEPFNDIGNFTLEHVNRVSNVFSLTPDSNGGIFRKVIPQQDVDIVSFRYVDYHGSVNQDPSTPVILDETYTPLKQVTDGSWTLGDSDKTKIDGTHYVHEFTLSTPIHLTANTPYWFLVGGNLSNQGNDWIINYQSPSVYNDLLLAKNLDNVNPYIVGNGNGEYQSSVRGMYLRLSDGTNTWVI